MADDAPSPDVHLIAVDRSNWREVADLEVHDAQRDFVAAPARYLALCAYDGVWTPLAIRAEDRIVGMLMWAVDPEDGACWLGGVLVDRRWQRQGIGRRAMELALDRLSEEAARGGFALSYRPENHAAHRVYAALGFVETGETDGDERVARLAVPT